MMRALRCVLLGLVLLLGWLQYRLWLGIGSAGEVAGLEARRQASGDDQALVLVAVDARQDDHRRPRLRADGGQQGEPQHLATWQGRDAQGQGMLHPARQALYVKGLNGHSLKRLEVGHASHSSRRSWRLVQGVQRVDGAGQMTIVEGRQVGGDQARRVDFDDVGGDRLVRAPEGDRRLDDDDALLLRREALAA